VVDQLSLQVPAGEIYGFLGPNGAGKTTTIRLLLGLIRADAGSVQVFGDAFDRSALRRIGTLVEVPSLYSHLTGRENLEVTRRLLGAPAASIDRALAVVRLTGDAGKLLRDYSLGMKQRLGLALALLSSPDLLILDEPTNGLDPAGIHEIRELLRCMPAEHGVTVFLSSHLLAEVEQIAGFVGIIQEGRMIFQGPLSDLHERHSESMIIGIRLPEPAVQLLKGLDLDACAIGPTMIRLSGRGQEPHTINRLLVESGHEVFHISLHKQSLEETFLSMTGDRTT
jgi:ABC-2 type transport system ATP-binding protein